MSWLLYPLILLTAAALFWLLIEPYAEPSPEDEGEE